MGTNITPEISKRKAYHISKHRYYELMHFCRQYDDFVASRKFLLEAVIPHAASGIICNDGSIISDKTGYWAMKLEAIDRKIELIENSCREVDNELCDYIFEAVTKGTPFSVLEGRGIPCSKNTFYDRYRKFFWLLDKSKDN